MKVSNVAIDEMPFTLMSGPETSHKPQLSAEPVPELGGGYGSSNVGIYELDQQSK